MIIANARFAEIFENFLKNLELCAQVRFTVRDYSGFTRKQMPNLRYSHDCAYCWFVKSDPKRDERCYFQDVTMPYSLFNDSDKPLLRYCHAGVCEVMVPLRSVSGELHGVIFCGQAKTKKSKLITTKAKIKSSLPLKAEKELLAVAEVVQEFCKANAHVLDALVEARKHSVEPGDIVKKAIDSMRTRYREHIDLSAIAKTVSLSPSRLAHLLKDHTGKSFTQNLRAIRMAEAHQLLSTTDIKVHSIAMMVGFDDPGYFHRLFKRLYSETPQEFRARIRSSTQQNK